MFVFCFIFRKSHRLLCFNFFWLWSCFSLLFDDRNPVSAKTGMEKWNEGFEIFLPEGF